MIGKSKASFRLVAGLLTSLVCINAAPAGAQALRPTMVDDPQVHVATMVRKCSVDLGSCLRDGFVSTFGPGAEGNQDVTTVVRTFSGIKAKNWVILSDTNYSDTVRIVLTVIICDQDTQVYLRTQYLKDDGKWKAMAFDVQTIFKDILLPYVPGGVQMPITQASTRTQ
jgi:hypothetical protein